MSSSIDCVKANLQDKIYILESILQLDIGMEDSLKAGHPDIESYDEYLDKSEELRARIDELELGFGIVVQQATAEMKSGVRFSPVVLREIDSLSKKLDQLLLTVADKEKELRKLTEKYFAAERSNIQKSRQSLKVAKGYSDIQNFGGAVSPHFMDDKK